MRASYRFRRITSIVVAMAVLVGLPLAGGAWLSSDGVVVAETAVTTQPAPAPSSTVVDTTTSTRPPVHVRQLAQSSLYPDVEVDEPSAPDAVVPVCADCDVEVTPEPASETQGVITSRPSIGDTSKGLPRAPEYSRLIPLDPDSAEDWRPLIEVFFAPGDVDRAVRVVQCESHGDPDAKNPRSTASGLFQHLASFWPERSVKAGYSEYGVFDPIANVAVAAWLVYDGGGWSHWNPSRGCWG